ncbi:MAG: hypothetical protein LBL55_00045 [Propionibacteriaceae bacterium]|jgi:hypothetical protein|nr:hypothetical protein [Propionibacteriaceae bacterium]
MPSLQSVPFESFRSRRTTYVAALALATAGSLVYPWVALTQWSPGPETAPWGWADYTVVGLHLLVVFIIAMVLFALAGRWKPVVVNITADRLEVFRGGRVQPFLFDQVARVVPAGSTTDSPLRLIDRRGQVAAIPSRGFERGQYDRLSQAVQRAFLQTGPAPAAGPGSD